MGEKIPISGSRVSDSLSIKYEDVFSLQSLYKMIREWLIANEYASNKKDEKMEKFYLEKHSGGAKELWIWWRTSKIPHGSKYFKYVLNIDYHVLGMKDVEIMHKGMKIKVNKGEVEILINCYLETEAEFQLKESLLRGIANMFRKKIYRKEIEQHKKDLESEMFSLQHDIKQFLELKGFLPKSELLHPLRGLG
ncbi:MAG: hypothetical protein QXG86_00090 [Candidatus Woesearchaeota archaeon]